MPSVLGSETRRRIYCAIDLGAESGRVVLTRLRRGILETQEIRRFPNEPVRYGTSLHWDVARLWWEICRALVEMEEAELDGIGVDAWGVDYALLGERGELLQNPYHYRDSRTRGVMEEVLRRIPKEEIYGITGIQFMPINTLYQLFAAKRDTPKTLESAERLLTIPDLFHYWLTGTPVCEFTNATTTQLVNPFTHTWAADLMDRLVLPSKLPAAIAEPGSVLGPLLPGVAGGRCSASVILPGSHDTASAVAAISARDGTAFLSSGTWSLVGTELDAPVITRDSLHLNFTNEGGVNGTTRLLKNVMGLWILQACRKSWISRGQDYSYEDLMDAANHQPGFQVLFNPDDDSFLSPEDMPAAIDRFCDKTHQPRPSFPAAYVRGTLESLAFKYRLVLESLEQLIGRRVEQIRVIGGGSRNRLLNQFTADATGKRVLAGPAEATALGNVAMQIVATGAAASLREVRALIDRSFPTEIYEPLDPRPWDVQAGRFRQYCELDPCLR
jgi:rhamnulokinase